jgi:GT2 family glycosyltransferase
MDDDEDIPENYLSASIQYRQNLKKTIKKDFILTPTLMYRHTGEIQNQGFSHFNYWLSRPIGCVLGQRAWARIQMYSGNSLFAPAYIFQQNKMDERFDFVYEDLTYSYGLYTSGYPLIVTKDIEIYHMERDKTKLENAWVGNDFQAYKKSKHKILFIKKYATLRQKIQFFLL